MPILILLEDTKKYVDTILKEYGSMYEIEIHDGIFQQTKSVLSNMDTNKLYVLLNVEMKPYRYEIYCLAKKQDSSYCVLSSKHLSQAKQDNPCIIIESELNSKTFVAINEVFNRKLKCSTAHKKKVVGGSYITNVKKIINSINLEYSSEKMIVLRDCECRLMRMIDVNPVDLDSVRDSYIKMVDTELKNKNL